MIYRFCDKIKFRFYGSKTKLKTDINSSLYTIWKAWKQSISNLKVSQINKNSKIWSCLNLCYFKMLFTVSIHNELMVLPIWAACCTRKLMIPCPTCCCDRILTLTPLLAWCKQYDYSAPRCRAQNSDCITGGTESARNCWELPDYSLSCWMRLKLWSPSVPKCTALTNSEVPYGNKLPIKLIVIDTSLG